MIDSLASLDIEIPVLKRIIEIQSVIAQCPLSLSAVMQQVVDMLTGITGADGALIELAQGDDMVYSAASGLGQNQLGLRVPIQHSLSGLCLTSEQPLICEDMESDPRVNKEICEGGAYRSMAVYPLSHDNRSIGAIKLIKSQPHGFGERELAIVKIMSSLIAASMSHASAYENAQHRNLDLLKLSTTDQMTGLPNRAAFMDRLRQALGRTRGEGSSFGLAILDLDKLKPINDEYGHRAGDMAITEFAHRISELCPLPDLPARLGGDEFGVIILHSLDVNDSKSLALELAQKSSGPFVFEGHSIDMACSAGVSFCPRETQDMGMLMKIADDAMYTMKRYKKTFS